MIRTASAAAELAAPTPLGMESRSGHGHALENAAKASAARSCPERKTTA
ncbi:hypothetical protein [Streptosporangium carneum]|nr:hypothetical protein [Streptosporangium carneum]